MGCCGKRYADRTLGWLQRLLETKNYISSPSGMRLRHIPNKIPLLIYKTTLKPIWAYGIQLWGTASTSNTEILERFQSKALRMMMDAPWYVPNTVIRKDLQIPTVKHEINRYSKRLSVHPILNLQEPPETRRLPKNLPIDLPSRFNM
jgi:hypothetical protein